MARGGRDLGCRDRLGFDQPEAARGRAWRAGSAASGGSSSTSSTSGPTALTRARPDRATRPAACRRAAASRGSSAPPPVAVLGDDRAAVRAARWRDRSRGRGRRPARASARRDRTSRRRATRRRAAARARDPSTSISRCAPRARARTSIGDPAGVCFAAFSSRFTSSCSSEHRIERRRSGSCSSSSVWMLATREAALEPHQRRAHELLERHPLAVDLDAAAFEPRHVEQVRDQPLQSLGLLAERVEQLAAPLGVGHRRGVAQRARGAGDRRERRAQIVRHRREQRAAHLLRLRAQRGRLRLLDELGALEASAPCRAKASSRSRSAIRARAASCAASTSTPSTCGPERSGTQCTRAPGNVSVPMPADSSCSNVQRATASSCASSGMPGRDGQRARRVRQQHGRRRNRRRRRRGARWRAPLRLRRGRCRDRARARRATPCAVRARPRRAPAGGCAAPASRRRARSRTSSRR